MCVLVYLERRNLPIPMIDACCGNAEIRLDFAFLFKFSSLSIEEKLHTYAGLERIEFDVVNRS